MSGSSLLIKLMGRANLIAHANALFLSQSLLRARYGSESTNAPRGEIMADKRNRVSGRCRGDFPRTPEFAYGYAIRTIIHTQATRFWMQFWRLF
jgi:hypothetical protein